MKDLFEQAVRQIAQELPAEEYRRWLSPVRYLNSAENKCAVQVPNIFFKNWIEENYLQSLATILSNLSGENIELELICEPAVDYRSRVDHHDSSAELAEKDESPAPGLTIGSLIEKYTFANFVVGSNNQLAHAASQAVAYKTASYNPLFIYGGSGLGKTHLLNAIGNHLNHHDKSLEVVYLSSEEFTNELIEALRSEGMSSFRQKYRNIDTLLIDDIHFIGGRERTQEEFFYTFNALHEANKQIVLSSDKMPKEIPDLEDRLRSRFEGGLFADITAPDRETKVAILSKKAEEEGIELSTEVAFYLASRDETNIRVLEGYLARLGAYSSLTGKPVDLPTAKKLLGLFIESDKKRITLDHIIKTTADFFNVKVADLKSSKKQKAISMPRQAAMYLARQLTSLSTIEIGQRFGGRDHSTVIHAVKRVEGRMEKDHRFSRTINDLNKNIRNSVVD